VTGSNEDWLVTPDAKRVRRYEVKIYRMYPMSRGDAVSDRAWNGEFEFFARIRLRFDAYVDELGYSPRVVWLTNHRHVDRPSLERAERMIKDKLLKKARGY
jgi:hypothetical protein